MFVAQSMPLKVSAMPNLADITISIILDNILISNINYSTVATIKSLLSLSLPEIAPLSLSHYLTYGRRNGVAELILA